MDNLNIGFDMVQSKFYTRGCMEYIFNSYCRRSLKDISILKKLYQPTLCHNNLNKYVMNQEHMSYNYYYKVNKFFYLNLKMFHQDKCIDYQLSQMCYHYTQQIHFLSHQNNFWMWDDNLCMNHF